MSGRRPNPGAATPSARQGKRDEGVASPANQDVVALVLRAIPSHRSQRGSVLIIVIWVCLGLVALTVYFAGSMSSELRAGDNRAADIVARQAAQGAMRYAAYILSQYGTNGAVPDVADYQAEQLPVGDASFWFIGRDPNQPATSQPVFGLVDEASKINLNTASRPMLEALPGMTPDLVDAIIAWRSSNGSANGGDNAYSRLDPPRMNKSGRFETVDELRLVNGATLALLLGEDANRNGALDDNENDNDQSAPHDNGDGVLQPGLWEYVTVYTSEPNTRAGGGRRINISTQPGRSSLLPTLQRLFGAQRANQLNATISAMGNETVHSVAEFMVRARLTSQEFARLRDQISASNASAVTGLINVNTASETVLACIPGIGTNYASTLVAYRVSHPDELTSLSWLTQVLPLSAIRSAGPYITDRSYQFSADVVAVGNRGRGFCREKTIFDMSRGTPRIIFHQDLAAYGWPLGPDVRQNLKQGITGT